MHGYKIHGSTRAKPACYIVSNDKFDINQAHQAFIDEFCKGACEDQDERPFLRMTEIRMELWKRRKEFGIVSDPLLDDLYHLFAEWCASHYKVHMLEEEQFEVIPDSMWVEDYVFALDR